MMQGLVVWTVFSVHIVVFLVVTVCMCMWIVVYQRPLSSLDSSGRALLLLIGFQFPHSFTSGLYNCMTPSELFVSVYRIEGTIFLQF